MTTDGPTDEPSLERDGGDGAGLSRLARTFAVLALGTVGVTALGAAVFLYALHGRGEPRATAWALACSCAALAAAVTLVLVWRRGVRAGDGPLDVRQTFLFGLVLLFALARLDQLRIAGAGRRIVSEPEARAFAEGLEAALDFETLRKPPRGTRVELRAHEGLYCVEAPTRHTLTVAATFVAMDESSKPHAELHCLQARSATELLARLRELVHRRAVALPMRLELFETRAELPAELVPLERLAFRPGTDGACAGRHCFLPAQLVAHRLFASERLHGVTLPTPPLAVDSLARRLRVDEPIVRVTLRAFAIDATGKVTAAAP